ncbi:MBL fold metallo-hydrolase [Lacticaseibacillus sp. GG6-2]
MPNLYTVAQVADNVYNISENITDRPIKFSQQLVIGTQRAALIDAGFGIDAGLVDEIRKLTAKPVMCLLTHGDPDHTGGAVWFDQVYMNPADDAILRDAFAPAFRLHAVDVASGHNQALVAHMQAAMSPQANLTYRPVQDGDRFDLGGTVLQALATPGHSLGSMCYVDIAHHLAFTGDSLATMVMSELYDIRCASLATWQTGLRRLQEMLGDSAQLFSGHRTDAFAEHTLSQLISGVDAIIAGDTQNDAPITTMPNGNVQDTAQMQPRIHRLPDSPLVVMYNALNL